MPRLEAIMPTAEVMAYLVNLAVAVSLVCGVGLLAARVCRRGSTPLRHGVLVWTLVLILVSPAAVWLAQRHGLAIVRITVSGQSDTHGTAIADRPASGVPATAPMQPVGTSTTGTESPFAPGGRPFARQSRLADSGPPDAIALETSSVSAALSKGSFSTVGRATSVSKEPSHPTWWQVIGSIAACVWAIGAALGLFRLVWGYVALVRFYRRLDPLSNPRQKLLVHQAADAVGLRKLPPVFLSHSSGAPVSIGLLRPVIVLPEAMPHEADEKQLQAVLLHEMAHISRHDHWVGVGQRIAAVLFWWNPLAHWVCDEISDLREEICDNHVVLVQGEGQGLARILVDLAARVTTAPLLPSTVGVMEPRLAGLTGRVTRLLDKERNMETRMNFRSKVFVFSCGLAVLIGMATVGGLRLAYAQPATEAKPAAAGQTLATSPGTRASAETPAGETNSTAGSEIKPDEAEATLLKAIRANREKLKCGILSWSRTTICDGFSDSGDKYQTAGTYKLWWDGDKMATAHMQGQVCKGDDRPMWIEIRSGGSSYDGGTFSARPKLGLYENWLDYIAQWNSHDMLIATLRKLPHVETRWSVVGAAGEKQLRLLTRSTKDGGYSIQCFDLLRGGQRLSNESYTAQRRLYATHARKLREVSGGVWFPIEVDAKSIKDGQVTLHQHYVLDMDQSSFNDRTAIPAGIFRLSAGEIEYKYQDELRRAYDKVKGPDRQAVAGKQSVSATAESETAIRSRFRRFEDAVAQDDQGAVASLLDRRKYKDRAANVIKEMRECLALGATPAIIRLVDVRGDRALVVTDFFDFADSRYKGKQCLVYLMARDDDEWMIQDIDMENVEGLVAEVRRFGAK